jgi:putative membrane protein insertion efficiency factor
MGHRDSSAQFGRHGQFFSTRAGIAEAASSRNCAQEHSGLTGRTRAFGAWLVLALVRFYQVFLSPFLGGVCRFYPSCSQYAYEAIERHGARRGAVLAAKRLLRCRPFGPGGFDPVPDKNEIEESPMNLRSQEPVH